MNPITLARLDSLTRAAQTSPRRRMNDNLHPTLDDPVQRMLNAFEPGTYVRPHRHAEPGRWELFLCLRGKMAVLTFSPDGRVLDRTTLEPEGPTMGAEIPADTWHAVVTLASGTVVFEVKQGPYVPLRDRDFAPWAPPEQDPRAAMIEIWYRTAVPGDLLPSREPGGPRQA